MIKQCFNNRSLTVDNHHPQSPKPPHVLAYSHQILCVLGEVNCGELLYRDRTSWGLKGGSQVSSRAPCGMFSSSQCKVSLICKCNNHHKNNPPSFQCMSVLICSSGNKLEHREPRHALWVFKERRKLMVIVVIQSRHGRLAWQSHVERESGLIVLTECWALLYWSLTQSQIANYKKKAGSL